MTDRPTLANLRTRVFKHSGTGGPEIGNWLARRVGRPSAVYGTWLAVRLGLSAHVVTSAALAANMLGTIAIGSGSRTGFVFGVVALMLGYWLDHVDGQVARWRGTACLGGVYFDYLMHHATAMALGFALGFGLMIRDGIAAWSLTGFLIAVGWTFLNLNNDCRYKAFFQRLKRAGRSYRVDGGSGGRPAPPPPWPMRWPGVVTWPASKACEPHVVLVTLALLSVAAVASPGLWRPSLRIYAASMAIVAPTLALARGAKAIGRGEADREFEAWFRSEEEDGSSRRGAEAGRG